MATVSILMALAALGVAALTLVWCQKLAENVNRLRTNVSDADARARLAELASEFPSLHARMEHLRQCWQADTGKLESVVRQLENRTAGLEQSHSGLATVAKDLDSLRESHNEVESALHQLESRTAALERGYGSLSTVAKDLDSLREFRTAVESVLRQVENRIVELEQGYRSLGVVSKDLDSLRAFRDHVEHIHAGIQKAFNGRLTGPSSALLPDEKTS